MLAAFAGFVVTALSELGAGAVAIATALVSASA